jgi:putative endonuclease
MSYFVYILISLKDGNHYIGSTENVEARLVYHNAGKQRSTKSRTPFILIYTESFESKSAAEKRERQTKRYKGGNAFRKLIGGV